ncbi:putative membrane protein, partial [Mucuna pruriens]
MASSQKGKFYIFFVLFFFIFFRVSCAPIDPKSCSTQSKLDHESYEEPIPEPQTTNHLNQQVFLDKLEEVVRNLSDIVARLESKLADPPKEKGRFSQIKGNDDDGHARSTSKGVEDGELAGKIRDGERTIASAVTKYTPLWSEKFQFASAVKLDYEATCINVLPFRDHEGVSKYVAVSDERGRVYVLLRNGDVLVEFDTLVDSPVRSMVSYTSVYKNESFVVIGHDNGEIWMHRVWEGGSSGEDYSSVFMENIGKFTSPEHEDRLPVTLVEVHYVGRIKYILSVDTSGKIKVFRENGSLYGFATPTSKPLVFLKQRLIFLTETGAGSLDLRSMKIKESECEGLNHSVARTYILDSLERSKAYGFTSDGDLIYVLLLGDGKNFKCRVRSKKKFDVEDPVALQAIRGYLLMVGPDKVFVHNISSMHYVRVAMPRLVFSSSLDELRASFLMSVDAEKRVTPLIGSDREKLVILGLGGGYVGIYQSNLPIFKGEFNTILWTSPVLFFVVFLFGSWHFFAKKKEALTSWGPDDPFSSTSAATGAASGSGDRSFGDSSSRSTEVMDLRVRAPPRRYGSPSRYAGGAATSYRLGAASDHNARPASVDPDFRASSELKFRASTMDPPGFPKRRDGKLLPKWRGDIRFESRKKRGQV